VYKEQAYKGTIVQGTSMQVRSFQGPRVTGKCGQRKTMDGTRIQKIMQITARKERVCKELGSREQACKLGCWEDERKEQACKEKACMEQSAKEQVCKKQPSISK